MWTRRENCKALGGLSKISIDDPLRSSKMVISFMHKHSLGAFHSILQKVDDCSWPCLVFDTRYCHRT